MDETKLRQLFKNSADAYLNTIDESIEQGMSEDCFIKAVNQAINFIPCCTELKPKQECYKSGEPCEYDCSGLCKESC